MTPPVPPHPALFIDFDGTLIPLADHPKDARCDAALPGQVRALQAALDGALAIVSGRTLASLTHLLGLSEVPAAGIHGLERRRSDGSVAARSPLDTAGLERVRTRLGCLARTDPRFFAEDKGVAIALHYPGAADQERAITALMQELAQDAGPEFELQPGRSVIELKPRSYTKGTALTEFMSEPAFRGRQPVAIGDDLSDLDAFHAAEWLGGMAIAVGHRVSGRWHLADPAAVRGWLSDLIAALGAVGTGSGAGFRQPATGE